MYSEIQWWLNCWRSAFLFELQLDDEDFESSDEEDGLKKTKVYVPPKVAAVPYGELSKAF